jgi:hypothetical protein
MSGVAILREMLANHPPVLALLPASRVAAGMLKQGEPLPALTVHQIGDTEEGTMARNTSRRMIRERVQVTALGKDWAEMKRLIRAANFSGVGTGIVKGFKVNSVLPVGMGPEIPPGDDGIYEQSRDFVVTFTEPN